MLTLEQVTKRFGTHTVLRDFSLTLDAGMIGCLLGPSGSGKTTVLRLIAGFETPDAGTIAIGGAPVADARRALEPHRRRVGMVFQDHALFPHLTVAENIAFGLRAWQATERTARVTALLRLIDLDDAAHKYPHELSGGQQQRVALARALAPRPRLLLLDEPFSNLDSMLRERLAMEVRRILKHEAVTALLVTHDQFEAFAIADRLGVVANGQLVQWDTPYGLYHQPQNRFVAEFVGEGAFLPGTFEAPRQVRTELGTLPCLTDTTVTPGDAVDVLLRPDDLVHDEASPVIARPIHAVFRGSIIRYTLRLASGAIVLMDHPSHDPLPLESAIGVRLDTRHVVVFRRTSAGIVGAGHNRNARTFEPSHTL